MHTPDALGFAGLADAAKPASTRPFDKCNLRLQLRAVAQGLLPGLELHVRLDHCTAVRSDNALDQLGAGLAGMNFSRAVCRVSSSYCQRLLQLRTPL